MGTLVYEGAVWADLSEDSIMGSRMPHTNELWRFDGQDLIYLTMIHRPSRAPVSRGGLPCGVAQPATAHCHFYSKTCSKRRQRVIK